MDYLKEYFRNVTTIYFGSMMGMIAYLTIDDSVKVNLNMLWEMVLIVLIFALLQYIFYSKKSLTVWQVRRRRIVHYLSLLIVLLEGARMFDWMKIEEGGILLSVIFTVVYIALTFVFSLIKQFKKEQMNEHLRQYKKHKMNRIGEK